MLIHTHTDYKCGFTHMHIHTLIHAHRHALSHILVTRTPSHPQMHSYTYVTYVLSLTHDAYIQHCGLSDFVKA